MSATSDKQDAPRTSTVRLIDAMPELLENLDERERRLAGHHLVAPLVHVRRGIWTPTAELQSGPGHLGLLVLEGLLTRDVILDRPLATELVGRGDLLRPADRDGPEAPIPFDIAWKVLEPVQIAVLDPAVSRVAGSWPVVMARILQGASNRAHSLAITLAVSHLRRIDHRLLVILWYLADRWGKVTPAGVLVPLRLTHETLARLVGAQRPSVSTALRDLSAEGRLQKTSDRHWLLLGEPPTTLVAPRTSTALSGDGA